MKIRLLTPQRIIAPAGTVVDVEDGRAVLLIAIGAAESTEPVIETAVAVPAAETADIKPKKTSRKKA